MIPKQAKYKDIDGQVLTIEIYTTGFRRYFNSKNKLHRLDGPAVEYADGSFRWCENDKPHRIGGPQYFNYPNSYKWWINGKQLMIYYICG